MAPPLEDDNVHLLLDFSDPPPLPLPPPPPPPPPPAFLDTVEWELLLRQCSSALPPSQSLPTHWQPLPPQSPADDMDFLIDDPPPSPVPLETLPPPWLQSLPTLVPALPPPPPEPVEYNAEQNDGNTNFNYEEIYRRIQSRLISEDNSLVWEPAYYQYVTELAFDNTPERNPFGQVYTPEFVLFQPGQLDCTNCSKFGEIVHINHGSTTTSRMIIHGGVGFFAHALMEEKLYDEQHNMFTKYSMMNLRTQDITWMKTFLKMYEVFLRSSESMIILNTLSSFYQSLNMDDFNREIVGPSDPGAAAAVALPPVEQISDDDSGNPNFEDLFSFEKSNFIYLNFDFCMISDDVVMTNANGVPDTRIRNELSAQRERAKRLRLEDFAPLFHLNLEEAARRLNFSTAVIKSKCREFSIPRWPGRKLRSIDHQLNNLQRRLRMQTRASDAAPIREEIDKLQCQKARIVSGLE